MFTFPINSHAIRSNALPTPHDIHQQTEINHLSSQLVEVSNCSAISTPKSFTTRTASDIIQSVFSINANQSWEYLKQYRFEPHGLYSASEFALHIEQYNQLPLWAERLKIEPSKGIMANLSGLSPINPDVDGKKIHLGDYLSEGYRGAVYEDANDDRFVIKQLKQTRSLAGSATSYSSDSSSNMSRSSTTKEYMAVQLWERTQEEAELFQKYYGQNTAEAINEEDEIYIRMLKIPGKELSSISNGELPHDSIELYTDMLERLTERGIMHTDLHMENILYHQKDRMFYPIDMSNRYKNYFNSMTETEKKEANQRDAVFWERILRTLQQKSAAHT